ncbi:MAG: hypothetical protein E6G01_05510 [Actinobacteria bacterium]|nr:MAG: hypothetical protein E6G01_05510 [Actinomycetota bacterium]
MQELADAQDTEFRVLVLPPGGLVATTGLGVGDIAHDVPFHVSARVIPRPFTSPTAMQLFAEVQSTEERVPSLPIPGALAVDCIDHDFPSQRSARVDPSWLPTAMQLLVDVQETPSRAT